MDSLRDKCAQLGTTFRMLESHDEHFYERGLFNYHWPLHGFGLPDAVLKKVCADNARRACRQARQSAGWVPAGAADGEEALGSMDEPVGLSGPGDGRSLAPPAPADQQEARANRD